MNLEELKRDLSDKCPNSEMCYSYFKKRFNGDNKERRSFNDLFEYYSKKDVDEKMLMKAMKELRFHAYYCSTPKRIVFFGFSPEIKFWINGGQMNYAHGQGRLVSKENNFGKYTPIYLEELWDSV